MASAAGDAGRDLPRRAAFESRPRRVVRGINLLAELEALTILGAGRFEVGVRYALNVFRAVPMADASGTPIESPFLGREDRRHWRFAIYEDDAYLLSRMGSTVSLALTHALGVAWPHVHSEYRERFAQRMLELPDDGIARSWRAAGGAPWWEPPKSAGEQTHLIMDDADALHSPGVTR